MTPVLLSIGSNRGDRYVNITTMVNLLKKILTEPIHLSSLMETEPVGTPDIQPWYYNCVILGQYHQTVYALLQACQAIERQLGRSGKGTMLSRTADIDILLFNGDCMTEHDLIVPHPQIVQRRFCLEGIVALASDWLHPLLNKSFRELYAEMDKNVLAQKIKFIHI